MEGLNNELQKNAGLVVVVVFFSVGCFQVLTLYPTDIFTARDEAETKECI